MAVEWNYEQADTLFIEHTNRKGNTLRTPSIVTVINQQYSIHPDNHQWMKIGLNAANGFQTVIQLINSRGQGVVLTHKTLQKFLKGPIWDWIESSFNEDHEQDVKCPLLTGKYWREHSLTYRYGAVFIEIASYDEIDGPVPIYFNDGVRETKTGLNYSTWLYLHDKLDFIDETCEQMEKLYKKFCSSYFDRLIANLTTAVQEHPEFDKTIPLIECLPHISNIIDKEWAKCVLCTKRSVFIVKRLASELKTFHKFFLATSVRNALYRSGVYMKQTVRQQ